MQCNNTFASHCLIFEGRMNHFSLKILQNFLVKIVIKTHVLNLIHFQGELVHIFLPEQGTEKCVKNLFSGSLILKI